MLSDTTTLRFPPSGKTSLPFTFEPQMVRCVAAGPGGRPLHVLVDTGTDPSAIDLGLARRLGLRLGDFALGQGAASDAVAYTETVLPWLRLGDLVLRDLFALALDLGGLPFPVDLVLGYNVLRQLVIQIDYRRRVVQLRHPDLGAPVGDEARLLPLAFFEHFPAFADVTLEDGLLLPLVTIDTGSNGGLSLGPDLAARVNLTSAAADVSQQRASGFGGSCTVVRRRARSLRIGPFDLDGIDLDALVAAAGDFGRPGRANLGNLALARLGAISLDYGRAQAWVGASG